MTKKLNLLILLCAISLISFGQYSTNPLLTAQQKKQQRQQHINQLMKEQEEGTLVFQKQNAFGIKLNTDGLGFFFEHGKYKTVTKTNLWWAELGERHDPKEDKQSNIYSDDFGDVYQGNPFIYGKINNFYYLRFGIGQQLLIGGKGAQNGVAVSFIYGGGISLALMKPYYLNVTDSLGNTSDIRYSAQTDSAFLGYTDDINQGSGFGKGLNEISVIPGINARAALRFDYGRFNRVLSAVEVGVNAEYYTKDIQIMVYEAPEKFYFSGYLAFVFGSRK